MFCPRIIDPKKKKVLSQNVIKARLYFSLFFSPWIRSLWLWGSTGIAENDYIVFMDNVNFENECSGSVTAAEFHGIFPNLLLD